MKIKDLYEFLRELAAAQVLLQRSKSAFNLAGFNNHRPIGEYGFFVNERTRKAIINYIALFCRNNEPNYCHHLLLQQVDELISYFSTKGGNLIHSNLTIRDTENNVIDYEELTPVLKLQLSSYFYLQQKAIHCFRTSITTAYSANNMKPHLPLSQYPCWNNAPTDTPVINPVQAPVNTILNPNERWLDTEEVCLLLNISKRTLQSYRDKNILPYSKIRGKIYYKASDIYNLRNSNYKIHHASG